MTTNEKIKKDIQTLNVGSPKVRLYKFDASGIGGSIYYITPGPIGGIPVVFNGQTYFSLPVEMEGVESNDKGKLPRPKITVSNVTKALLAEVIAYNDLVGAIVTRQTTFKKYLDDQSEADPFAEYPQDIYVIKRKVAQNKNIIQFELRAALDLEYILCPKRQVLLICGHTYRIWNGSSFSYDKATCPYVDTDYYTESGAAITAENDKCGYDLFSCRKRFPSTNFPDEDQLPGRFFPGVGKLGSPYRR